MKSPLSLPLLVSTMLLVAPAACSDSDPPPNFDSMLGQTCPNYRCSSGQSPVPKSRLKFESQGCSGMGNNMMLKADSADVDSDGELYENCCHQFHACYQVCGVSKAKCDNDFEACSRVQCAGNPDCEQSANLAQMMVKLGRCQKFDQAQYRACECVAKDKVDAKRLASIKGFYKKVLSSSEDVSAKAAGLAKKADTASKLAGLFLKLLKKYPDIIVKVEDPQQAEFKKMFREAKEEGKVKDESGTTVSESDDEEESDEKIEL